MVGALLGKLVVGCALWKTGGGLRCLENWWCVALSDKLVVGCAF